MGLGGMFGKGDHSSVLGKIGGKIQKWTDPIAMIPGVGDKWVDLTSNKIPELTNKTLSKVMTPFDRIDETINPVRQIPIVDRIGDVVRDKPGDALGLAIGGYFAAPAIAGAAGGAAGGGSTAASGIGGGLGGGVGGISVAPGFVSGGTALGGAGGGGTLGSFMSVGGGGLGGLGAAGSAGSAGSANPISVSPNFQSGGTWTQDLSGMRPQANWTDLAQQFMGQQQQQAQQRGQQQQDNGLQQLMAENDAKRQAQAMALAQFDQMQAQAAAEREQYRRKLAAQLRG